MSDIYGGSIEEHFKRGSETQRVIAAAKARGDFDRFGKDNT
ncbi:MAG: hypothetical protein AAFQ66_13470 [Pseudomonadota bacterium]